MEIRTDLALMSEWIIEGSHVLDLGCGDGRLLAYLRKTCQITGYGLEIDDDNIVDWCDTFTEKLESNQANR